MRCLPWRPLSLALLVGIASAPAARAQPLAPGAAPGYVPKVPVSALARPILALDPSRLHISTAVTVGSGWGSGTQALQVTSLSYRFAAPLELRVGVGNAWGPGRDGSSLFLEGLDLSFRPGANTLFQLHYQNFRSPLQFGSASYYAPAWAR